IQAIAAQAKSVLGASANPGVLQLVRLHPMSKDLVPTRYTLDDVEDMIKAAIADCEAGHNVYIEGRTLPASLRGSERGKLEATIAVFALVIDSDADKGMGWAAGDDPPEHDRGDLAWQFSVLVLPARGARRRAGTKAGRAHPSCHQQRPRHRQSDPALSRRRDNQLSLAREDPARARHGVDAADRARPYLTVDTGGHRAGVSGGGAAVQGQRQRCVRIGRQRRSKLELANADRWPQRSRHPERHDAR